MLCKQKTVVYLYIACSQIKRCDAESHLPLGVCKSLKRTNSLPQIMKRWQEMVENSKVNTRVRAVELYGGGIWKELRSDHSALRKEGIEIRIVSAGLGLLSTDDLVPAYDATFGLGSENSIRGIQDPVQRNRDWWALLGQWHGPWSGPRSLHATVRKFNRATHIFALPTEYMDAVLDDVDALISDEHCRSRTIVLATPTFAALRHVPRIVEVPGDLYGALGGTRGTVLARAGLYLARQLHHQVGDLKSAREAFRPLLSRLKPMPIRTGCSDDEVTKFIRAALARNPRAFASPLLKQFRSIGFACEQSRFGKLHKAIKNKSKSIPS